MNIIWNQDDRPEGVEFIDILGAYQAYAFIYVEGHAYCVVRCCCGGGKWSAELMRVWLTTRPG